MLRRGRQVDHLVYILETPAAERGARQARVQAASPPHGHIEDGGSVREPTAARYFFGFPMALALDVAGGRLAVQYLLSHVLAARALWAPPQAHAAVILLALLCPRVPDCSTVLRA